MILIVCVDDDPGMRVVVCLSGCALMAPAAAIQESTAVPTATSMCYHNSHRHTSDVLVCTPILSSQCAWEQDKKWLRMPCSMCLSVWGWCWSCTCRRCRRFCSTDHLQISCQVRWSDCVGADTWHRFAADVRSSVRQTDRQIVYSVWSGRDIFDLAHSGSTNKKRVSLHILSIFVLDPIFQHSQLVLN